MNYFVGLLIVVIYQTSMVASHGGCSTACCYSSVKFYCCPCDKSSEPPVTSPPHIPVTDSATPLPPISVTGGSNNVVVTSNIQEDVNVHASVNLENQINNVNKVSSPINIHHTNINSVSYKPRSPVPVIPTPPSVISITVPTATDATVATTEKLVWTSVAPQNVQCCKVVKPCDYSGCQPNTQTCGKQCVTPVVYIPYNPCPSYGCYKRTHWVHTQCARSSCYYVRKDCSSCNQNFYKTYSTFKQCYGCFGYGGGYGGGYTY